MKEKEFYYLNINEQKNMIYSIGISFSEFINAVAYQPQNILLLKSDFEYTDFDLYSQFEYVTKENINKLYQANVYNYGDFCWVDFVNNEALQKIEKHDIANLLFAAHKFESLDRVFFNSLKNEYLYLAHDDEYHTRVYMKNIENYKNVIATKIKAELKGRRKEMTDISQEIVTVIYQQATKGLLIDFNNIIRDKKTVSVNLYSLGELYSYDSILQKLAYVKQQEINYKTLVYKNKKWELYEQK